MLACNRLAPFDLPQGRSLPPGHHADATRSNDMRQASAVFAFLVLTSSLALAASEPGWVLQAPEPGESPVAVTKAVRTNLNLGAVVLACERGALRLELHPSTATPLLPAGATRAQMNDAPRVELTVDGRPFAASILFADEHAVVADREDGRTAALSGPLVEALAVGTTLEFRFDLLRETAGQPPASDGTATVDLKAGNGGAALAAVRRACSTD
jgi:hypothetical protein